MQKTAPRYTNLDDRIYLKDLRKYGNEWLMDGGSASRRGEQEAITCGMSEVRSFLAYLNKGHEN